MNTKDMISKVDHTLLSVTATWQQVQALCDEAVEYGAASVCIPPSYVARARKHAGEKLCICTVIGFPNGYSTTEAKAAETADAVKNGADEIDMVINLGWVKDGLYHLVLEEIQRIKAACGDKLLKVIVETCLLTQEEKIRICQVVTQSGAEYIKTSTGFSTGGATFADVALFAEHIGPAVKIKAAGGISSLEDARRFLELGASRLGTSRVIKLVRENKNIEF